MAGNKTKVLDNEMMVKDPNVQDVPEDTTKTLLNSLGQEFGASGTKLFGGQIYEEYNPKLAGQAGLQVFEEMRRSDAQVQATLLAMELPIRSTKWYVQPGETKTGEGETEVTDQDKEIAAFVEDALFKRMDITFDDFLRQALTMLPFGFSLFEKVYKEEGGKIYLKKLAQRLARSVWKWNREPDGRVGITQFLYMNDEGKPANVEIPASKLLVFSFRREGDNFQGVSVLRSSYKPWYIKDTLYKLDAVKHERMAIGIPVLTLPQSHTDNDEAEAEKILSSLRATEKSYVILPNKDWEFKFADMGSGKVIDSKDSIEHHNREIAKNILAQFLDLGAGGKGGSYALSEDQSSLFILSLQAIANQIRDELNRCVIPELVDANFPIVESQTYPSIAYQKLGDVAYDKLATALASLTGGGLLTPDADLEDHLRDMLDLPKKMEPAEGTQEDTMEDVAEGEDPTEVDDAATEVADQEDANATAEDTAAAEDPNAPSDADLADQELAKLDKQLQSLEASEMARIGTSIGSNFSETEANAFIFASTVTDETKSKISEALKKYWAAHGKKAPDELVKQRDQANTTKQDTSTQISKSLEDLKKSIDPLKKKLAEIQKLKDSMPAGKRLPAQRAKIRQMAAAVRAEINKLKGESNAKVTGLKDIKATALKTAKDTNEEIKQRKAAIEGVISKLNQDVADKNATRSESIRALADQIRANAENIRQIKDAARSQASGLK